MSNEHTLAAALAHELREQSRFPSGQPRISPEKAREIVAAALRSQPVEAGERFDPVAYARKRLAERFETFSADRRYSDEWFGNWARANTADILEAIRSLSIEEGGA